MLLEIKLAYDREDEVRNIFKEYTDMLVNMDKKFEESLKAQKYDNELSHHLL